MYKLAVSILITILLSFTYHPQAKAIDCKDMEGKYSVVSFTRPLGLAEAAAVYGLSAPLGTPVFKVEKEAGKFNHQLCARHRIKIKVIASCSTIFLDLSRSNKLNRAMMSIKF